MSKSQGGKTGGYARWGIAFIKNFNGSSKFDRYATMAKISKCGRKQGGMLTAEKRWGYRFIINNYGPIDNKFDRYQVMADMSTSGRTPVQHVSFIRNNDRGRFDEIEQARKSDGGKIGGQHKPLKTWGVRFINNINEPIEGKFDRYVIMSKISKCGRKQVANVLFIRKNVQSV